MFEIFKAVFGEELAQSLLRLWRSLLGLLGLLGPEEADKSPEQEQDVRDPGQFRTHLPYRTYDQLFELFTLTDGIGFVLEAMPQSGADQSMADMLRGLYTAPWAAGASLQITLFATPHIKPLLLEYANLRATDDDQSAARPAMTTCFAVWRVGVSSITCAAPGNRCRLAATTCCAISAW